MNRFLLCLLLAAPLLPSVARAGGDDIEDLDSEGKSKAKAKTKAKTEDAKAEVIREIEKGFYAKADIGSTSYLGTFRGTLRSGTALSLAVGDDFVDHERNSLSWEIAFSQGVHNGMSWDQEPLNGVPPQSLIQGDSRTFSGLANLEYSIYPARRLGIGLRVGGGVVLVPLLMNKEAYIRDVVPEWGGIDPALHHGPHPLGFGGPTLEYYTKLSHFSVGADVDVSYAVGFDLGLTACGYMKYTF